MAASSNSNQINLSADGNGLVTVSGTVVLLKDESLTLADSTAVSYANYGNYKAVKVTDGASNSQYIVSLKGVKDVVRFAIRNALGNYIDYAVTQHSLEYSDADKPLVHFADRQNAMFLYDSSLTSSNPQSRDQQFKHEYQVEISSAYTTVAKYDLLKGAAIGDTVTIKFYKNQQVKALLDSTTTTYNDGRLAELSGNSDIYEYVISSITLPNDERVDGNKPYTVSDKAVWSLRPGSNKILFNTVSSNNNKAVRIFLDAQGFRTGGTDELGYTSSTFGDDYGGFSVYIENKDGDQVAQEQVTFSPDTQGFDKCGRYLGTYITGYEAEDSEFPLKCRIALNFSNYNGEYLLADLHNWEEYDVDHGSIGATNPDIVTGELENDPFCLDRQHSSECLVFISNLINPWSQYEFITDSSGTGGGGNATTITKLHYSDLVTNQKIQYTGAVTKESNFLIKSTSADQGLVNSYSYQTKKFRISTQDRPSMIRTLSMTYTSFNNIVVRIDIDNGAQTKDIVFNKTTERNKKAQKKSVTEVIGLRAKNFSLTIFASGVNPDILEISKLSVTHG